MFEFGDDNLRELVAGEEEVHAEQSVGIGLVVDLEGVVFADCEY